MKGYRTLSLKATEMANLCCNCLVEKHLGDITLSVCPGIFSEKFN